MTASDHLQPDQFKEIKPGDHVSVEATYGLATNNPVTHQVSGHAFQDTEGGMRVDDGTHEINLSRDASGAFRRGVVLLSHTPKSKHGNS